MKLQDFRAACADRRRHARACRPRTRSSRATSIKIGFITDMSGLYADIDGPGGAEAIKMAIADMGGAVNGKKIEVARRRPPEQARHRRRQGARMVRPARHGHAGRRHQLRHRLAMAKVAAEKKKPFIVDRRRRSSALTNEQCTPYTVHYAYDTMALAKGTGARGRQGRAARAGTS